MNTDITYIGEHLLPGYIGHFSIILLFCSALFSVFCYRQGAKTELESKGSWTKMGRVGFGIHSIALFSIIAMLFYVMVNKYYEYSYAQAHVSDDLPMQYILSAFWEGQEGSFLLWMFWHIILGWVVIARGKMWESSVLLFVGLAEVVLASMLLGLHIEIGDFIYKVGSNPTTLLRDIFEAPIFEKADYVEVISGTGLNPLLQNYWMTIHPPVLFLGFASVTFPFAYAAAGLYTGQHREWLHPGLKWGLFSAGFLGTGILMGSAWAYEALTFGGYWAWDPVENMSLVPWLVLVGGIHANLIARSTGRAIRSTYIYYCLAFVLILYSTYLTRSGILGDTSQHAFTEMGLEPQLIFMVGFFGLLSTILYIAKSRIIPVYEKEESIYSREFWMSIGALVLLFSGLIISASTSLPVMNAIIGLYDPEFVGTVIEEPIPHFNKFQVWISVMITLLTGSAIHLRYRAKSMRNSQKMGFFKQQLLYAAIAAVITFLTSLWIEFVHWKYIVLAFCSLYAVVSNLAYLVSKANTQGRMTAAVLSHFGFGIMIIGILSSGLNESTITTNRFAMEGLLNEKDQGSTIQLIKNAPMYSNGYWITYEGDTVIDLTRIFKIKMEEETESGREKPFYLYPNALFSNDMTKVASFNPDTKHYVHKDIFTQIAGLPKSQLDIEFVKEEEDSLKYVKYELSPGDTIFTKKHYGIVTAIDFNPKHKDYVNHKNDIGIGVVIDFKSLDNDETYTAQPAIGIRENLLYQYNDQINDLHVKLKLNEASFDNFFTTEDKLSYSSHKLKQGQQFNYNGESYVLNGFDQPSDNPNYKEKEGDIPVMAKLVRVSDNHLFSPIYIIRDSKPFNIKAHDPFTGVHVRMTHVDPVNEEFTFLTATDIRTNNSISLEIAENVVRNDMILFEATVFPGINLFWTGTILMMLGFFIGLYNKRRKTSVV